MCSETRDTWVRPQETDTIDAELPGSCAQQLSSLSLLSSSQKSFCLCRCSQGWQTRFSRSHLKSRIWLRAYWSLHTLSSFCAICHYVWIHKFVSERHHVVQVQHVCAQKKKTKKKKRPYTVMAKNRFSYLHLCNVWSSSYFTKEVHCFARLKHQEQTVYAKRYLKPLEGEKIY